MLKASATALNAETKTTRGKDDSTYVAPAFVALRLLRHLFAPLRSLNAFLNAARRAHTLRF